MFHGDQRTITLVSRKQDVYTYDILDGRGLYQGRTNLPDDSVLGANWTNGEILWFAMMSGSHNKPVIDIYELQPTPSLHILSSFPLTQSMEYPINLTPFHFSPVSSHASFPIRGGVVVVDVQNSELLLQTELDGGHPSQAGQFSPDGCFFISGPFQNAIHIWQNTPAGYVPWSSIRLQVWPWKYLWSPTSMSILCWSQGVLQLLHPGNCPSPPLPNKAMNQNQNDHLVAYSADKTYIATVRQSEGIVTVLNCVSGTSWQFTNAEMDIQDIKIADSTIFVVDNHKLVGWALETDGIVHGTFSARRVTVDETLMISGSWMGLRLSHDCSQIAFIEQEELVLYNIKTQDTIHKYIGNLLEYLLDFWFSPDGHWLWFADVEDQYGVVELGAEQDEVYMGFTAVDPVNGQIIFNRSSHGYHIRTYSGWVTDSRGRNLLWLPPSWRANSQSYMRWDGVFLALLNGNHPEPIIIKFNI